MRPLQMHGHVEKLFTLSPKHLPSTRYVFRAVDSTLLHIALTNCRKWNEARSCRFPSTVCSSAKSERPSSTNLKSAGFAGPPNILPRLRRPD